MAHKASKIDPLKNYISVNLYEAEELIVDIFRAGWVPNLISSPGLGKSSVIKQIADKQDLCLIDIRMSQMDPADMNGFPFILNQKDKDVQIRAGYVPMNIFPIVGDIPPINPKTGKPYKGWVIFLDEFNAGALSVQAAAYKLILDKMVGMHKLHENVVIALAGNLMTDKAITNRLSTATQSRLIHLPIRVCNQTWHWWADSASLDFRVTAFVKFMPEELHNFNPNHTDLTFSCPRTWEMMSDLVAPWKKVSMKKLPLFAGTVGVGAARSFMAFCEIYKQIPTIEEILANPQGAPIGNEPSMHHALAGLIGFHMAPTNAKESLIFLDRLGADFQVVALRKAIARDISILQCPEITTWKRENAKELIRGGR